MNRSASCAWRVDRMPQLVRDARVPSLHSHINGRPRPEFHNPAKRAREESPSDVNIEAEPRSSSESESPDRNVHKPNFKTSKFGTNSIPEGKKRRASSFEKSNSFSGSSDPKNSNPIWSDDFRRKAPTRTYASHSKGRPNVRPTSTLRSLNEAAAELPKKDIKAVKKTFQKPSFPEEDYLASKPSKKFIKPAIGSDRLPKPPVKPNNGRESRLETPAKEIVRNPPTFIVPTITPTQPPLARKKSMSLPLEFPDGSSSPPPGELQELAFQPPASKSAFRVPNTSEIPSLGDIPVSGSTFRVPDFSEPPTIKSRMSACPVCRETLDRDSRQIYEDENGPLPQDMRVPFKLQARIHHAHRKSAAIKAFVEKGYPTQINWKRMQKRVSKHDKMLAQVVISEDFDSPYRKQYLNWFVPTGDNMPLSQKDQREVAAQEESSFDSDEDLSLLPLADEKTSSQSTAVSKLELPVTSSAPASRSTMSYSFPDFLMQQMIPGYYGPKGARLFTELVSRLKHVQNALYRASRYNPEADSAHKLKSHSYATPPSSSASTSTLPSSKFFSQMQRVLAESRIGGTVGFVQTVLVPELAVHLVMEDLGVSLEQARKVVDESAEMGNLVHPDEGGEGDYIDASRLSKEISVFASS